MLLATFAKMMFDEAELFKGLTAWFSSSVSASVQSQWGKLRVVSKTAKLNWLSFFRLSSLKDIKFTYLQSAIATICICMASLQTL